MVVAFTLRRTLVHHREMLAQQARERSYQSVSAKLQSLIFPGMQRSQVESILKLQGATFNLRSGKMAWDILVPLGRERSPVYFCSFMEAQTLIEFQPDAHASSRSSKNDSEEATDMAKRIGFERQLGDCL